MDDEHFAFARTQFVQARTYRVSMFTVSRIRLWLSGLESQRTASGEGRSRGRKSNETAVKSEVGTEQNDVYRATRIGAAKAEEVRVGSDPTKSAPIRSMLTKGINCGLHRRARFDFHC